MELSTKNILLIGLIQCVILTIVLMLFFRYQQSQEQPSPAPPSERGPGIDHR